MTKLNEFQTEIRQKFLLNATITVYGFYGQYPTNLLEKVRIGFERDFDMASQGEPYRQPVDWLSDRIRIISAILSDREAERPRTMGEKMWARVENGYVKPIRTKWNRP